MRHMDSTPAAPLGGPSPALFARAATTLGARFVETKVSVPFSSPAGNTASVERVWLNMIISIYQNVGWQFLAYYYGGIKEINREIVLGMIPDAVAAAQKKGADLAAAWADINSGAPAKINTGNILVANQEQNFVLGNGHGYAQLDFMTLFPATAFTAAVPVSTALTLGTWLRAPVSPFTWCATFATEMYYNYEIGAWNPAWGPVDLANDMQRWWWITNTVWPAYRKLTPSDLAKVMTTSVETLSEEWLFLD